MWTLWESLTHYKKIDEYTYEELSKASLYSMVGHEFELVLNDLEILYTPPENYTMLLESKRANGCLNLDGYADVKELKKLNGKKVDCVLGYVDVFEYTIKSLDVLSALDDKGFALILIPSLNYQEVKGDLEKQGYFINAIFSSDDSRSSTNSEDLAKVIPVYCKYLALSISKKEFDCLYVHTEESFDYDLGFQERLKDGIELSNSKDIYKDILKGDGVFVADKSFVNLDHFYLTNQIGAELDKYQDYQEYRLKDIAKSVGGFYWILPKLLVLLENYKETNKGKCLKYVTELIDSVQISTDTDTESEFFSLDQTQMTRYDELHTALTQLWNQLMAGDTLQVPKYFNQFSTWISVDAYSYKYKPNDINIQSYKNISRSEYDIETHWEDDLNHSSTIVSIDQDVILPEYLELYLSTKIGKLNVEIAALETSKDNLEDAWKNIKILAPSIGDQRLVVSAINKFNKLRCELDVHKDELASNPFNAGSINLDLDDWLLRLGKLSTSEDSLHLIKKGESDTVEFKETLSFNLKSKQQTPATKKEMELSVLKTIVGFLNKRGGTLFIGVADDGTVSGIDNDLHNFHKNSADKLLLHFKNILKERIGDQYLSFWRYEVITLNGNNIIRMDCIPTLDPCFYESGRFFVRTNPATVELKGTDMVSYMKTRFKE